MMPVSVDRYLAPNLMKKQNKATLLLLEKHRTMKWKFCKTAFVSLKLQLEKNVYLISDILVCGITEYFMKLSGIFWSSLSKQK